MDHNTNGNTSKTADRASATLYVVQMQNFQLIFLSFNKNTRKESFQRDVMALIQGA